MPTRVTRSAALGLTFVLLLPPAVMVGIGQTEDYRIGPRDVLDVSVWQEASLTGKYTVGADGTFAFPLIGEVKAAGLTVRDIETDIRRRLSDGFLRDPQVTVKVAEYLSQRVFVVGEVGTPGPVPLSGNLTLLEALSKAGSLAATAGTELMLLRRAEGAEATSGPLLLGQAGTAEVTRINLALLQNGQFKENVALRDGDTIFVPKAEQIFVLGQVKLPGAFPFTRELTVFKAISMAGGMTELGSSGRIRIVRIVKGEKREVKAKLTDTLEPGDSVMVPTRWF